MPSVFLSFAHLNVVYDIIMVNGILRYLRIGDHE